MKRIVVAAKAGADQPWLADAAADIAEEMGAEVAVVSMDGIELEALSTVPRGAVAESAAQAAAKMAERIAARGIHATPTTGPGPSCAACSCSRRSRRRTWSSPARRAAAGSHGGSSGTSRRG